MTADEFPAATTIQRAAAFSAPRTWRSPTLTQALLLVLAFALALTLINPSGYIGGGGDEYQYLTAARCVAKQGFCIAHDHWWRRWPIVVPAGIALRLFGENQVGVGIVPLIYALGALALMVKLVGRAFGHRVALGAGIVLAATPVFTDSMLELNIDIPELVFALGALLCLYRLLEDGERSWAVGAGLLTGLAIQARPTSLVLLPIFICAILLARRRDWLLPFAVGAMIPNLAEAIVYAVAAHDPLLPWRLSLAHTTIPSTELLSGVDMRQSPLFNPAFIGGWKRPLGIHIHWTIDGLLNLVLHPAIALTLLAAAMMTALEYRTLARPTRQNRALWFLIALAIIWLGAMVYGFAIDPKPRMFLLLAVVASICFAALSARRWATSKGFACIALALILLKGFCSVYDRQGLWRETQIVPGWIAAYQPDLAIERRTARFLALVPEAARLPIANLDRPARYTLLIGDDSCAVAAREAGLGKLKVTRAQITRRVEPAPIMWMREHGLLFSPPFSLAMCILSPAAGQVASPPR